MRSTSKSVMPCDWFANLYNSRKNCTRRVLYLWPSVCCWKTLDREVRVPSEKTSDLISKLPTSGNVTPSKMSFSVSASLNRLRSTFRLSLLMASLKAVQLATSATAELCLSVIRSSFLLSSSVNLITCSSNCCSRSPALLNLSSRFWIFFSSSTTWFSFSFSNNE